MLTYSLRKPGLSWLTRSNETFELIGKILISELVPATRRDIEAGI